MLCLNGLAVLLALPATGHALALHIRVKSSIIFDSERHLLLLFHLNTRAICNYSLGLAFEDSGRLLVLNTVERPDVLSRYGDLTCYDDLVRHLKMIIGYVLDVIHLGRLLLRQFSLVIECDLFVATALILLLHRLLNCRISGAD